MSFSLHGDQGTSVIAAGYPQSAPVPCDAFGDQTDGQPTAATPPGLTFAPGNEGRYTYQWRTETGWRGTCRQLIVMLDDGTYHRVNVGFR